MADDLEKEVLKIQRDVALDKVDDTALERDMALTQEARLARERNVIAGQRDAAFTRASVEQESATKSATAFYVLLAVAVLAAIVIAAVYFNRPGPQAGTTVLQPVGPVTDNAPPVILNRQAPVAPAASTPTSSMPAPQVLTRPAPTPPPAPVIVNTPPQTVIVNTPPAAPAQSNTGPLPSPAAPMAEGTGNNAAPAAPPADSGANAGGANAGGTAPVTSTAPAAPTTSAAPPSGQ